MARALWLLVLLALAIPACDRSRTDGAESPASLDPPNPLAPPSPVDPPGLVPAPSTSPVPDSTIAYTSELIGGIDYSELLREPGYEVIESSARYREFVSSVRPAGAGSLSLPRVDFEQNILLVAWAGLVPTRQSTIAVDSVRTGLGGLTALGHTTHPGVDCFLEPIPATPWTAVGIPRLDRPISWEYVELESSCPSGLFVTTRRWAGNGGGRAEDGGGYRGLSYASRFLLDNEDSLSVFWNAAYPHPENRPALPILDFDREVFLVITRGWNVGCVETSIDSLHMTPGSTVVFATRVSSYGRSCILCEYTFSRDWAAAAIPKPGSDPEWRFTNIGVACAGAP